jgi:SsrA-binding protein
MKTDLAKRVDIRNKSASFEFEILDKLTAGIVTDSFCQFKSSELFVVNLHIATYTEGTYNNHIPKRERKLLIKKAEMRKWQGKMEEKGLTIVLTRLFIDENGRCKVDIALARGKKIHDKRDSIKERDLAREMRRND